MNRPYHFDPLSDAIPILGTESDRSSWIGQGGGQGTLIYVT